MFFQGFCSTADKKTVLQDMAHKSSRLATNVQWVYMYVESNVQRTQIHGH